MEDESKSDDPGELYDAAVGDGTTEAAPEPTEKPAVTASDASNYGGSAIDDRR